MYNEQEPTDIEHEDEHSMRKFIVALILSIFFIHLPIIYILSTRAFDSNKMVVKPKKEQIMMVNLNKGNTPKRIADIAKPKVQKKPKKASAWSLYNSSVKKETVSKRFSKKQVPYGSKQQKPKTQQPKPKVTKKVTHKSETDKLNKKYTKQVQKKYTTPKDGLSMQDKLRELKDQHKQKEQQKHASLYKSSPKKSPIFRTNLGSPSGGSTGEYFRNYKVGNKTYLNALANPHVSFFVQLRRKFRFTFNPAPVLRTRINEITKGRISVVWGLSVDSKGNMSGLRLLRSSGISAYDYEAKRTITASAPFSRPPAQLLTKDNQIHMAWTFVVYL